MMKQKVQDLINSSEIHTWTPRDAGLNFDVKENEISPILEKVEIGKEKIIMYFPEGLQFGITFYDGGQFWETQDYRSNLLEEIYPEFCEVIIHSRHDENPHLITLINNIAPVNSGRMDTRHLAMEMTPAYLVKNILRSKPNPLCGFQVFESLSPLSNT